MDVLSSPGGLLFELSLEDAQRDDLLDAAAAASTESTKRNPCPTELPASTFTEWNGHLAVRQSFSGESRLGTKFQFQSKASK